MTKDLISRRDAVRELSILANRLPSGNYSQGVQRCIGAIKGLPSTGQAMGSGRWIRRWVTSDGTIYRCSECGAEYCTEEEEMFFKFCPECGADMRSEDAKS